MAADGNEVPPALFPNSQAEFQRDFADINDWYKDPTKPMSNDSYKKAVFALKADAPSFMQKQWATWEDVDLPEKSEGPKSASPGKKGGSSKKKKKLSFKPQCVNEPDYDFEKGNGQLGAICLGPDMWKQSAKFALKCGFRRGSRTVLKPNGDPIPGGQPGVRVGNACSVHSNGCTRTLLQKKRKVGSVECVVVVFDGANDHPNPLEWYNSDDETEYTDETTGRAYDDIFDDDDQNIVEKWHAMVKKAADERAAAAVASESEEDEDAEQPNLENGEKPEEDGEEPEEENGTGKRKGSKKQVKHSTHGTHIVHIVHIVHI